jgi:hypothetical protein
MLCGPPAMIHSSAIPALEKAGFIEETIFEF